VEGAALWGMSMALYEGSEFTNGQPKDSNTYMLLRMSLYEGSEFINGQPKDSNTYMLLRMSNVPEIEIEFLPSSEIPVGPGEP
jgi:CO/xanthine dehydrogenase Mo-binding subunit